MSLDKFHPKFVGITKVLVALLLTGLAVPLFAHPTTDLVTFDAPVVRATLPSAINSRTSVTGFYSDGLMYHGFVRDAHGAFTTFDAPGLQAGDEMLPYSMNNAGVIAGFLFQGVAHDQHSFVRDADGRITVFDPPGATDSDAVAINDAGTIAGSSGDATGAVRGFLRDAHGSFTLFDVPGSDTTLVTGIDSDDSVIGQSLGDDGVLHGFVRDARQCEIRETVTTFDPAGSSYTYPAGIAHGVIAGFSVDASGMAHGFVRRPDGTMTSFDPVGSVTTIALAINSSGTVTGWFYDSSFASHGFLRDKSGTITVLDVPGSTDTIPVALDEAGVVTGYYYDENGTRHGFVGGPSRDGVASVAYRSR